MIRRTYLIVLLSVIFAIVCSLPQQPKSRRPVPEFKVRRIFIFTQPSIRRSITIYRIFSNCRTELAVWNFRITRHWSGKTSWITSRARTEFTDTTRTWRTIAKFSTFACRRPEALSDGASFVPRKLFLIKRVVVNSFLNPFYVSVVTIRFLSSGHVRLHEDGEFYTVRGVWEFLQLERSDR